MATKKTNTTVAKVEAPGALARPDFIPASHEGRSHMTREDVVIPGLAIAQQLSPQLIESDPKFIDGLKAGEMFNTLTKQIGGKGPIQFHIVKATRPRWMEFIPREQGGGIKDFNVPANDPRTQWGENGEKPVATKIYDFLIVPSPFDPSAGMLNSVLALSMSNSKVKVAKGLNSLIQGTGAAVYAGLYEVSTFLDSNAKKQSFHNYRVTYKGGSQNPTFVQTPEEFAFLKSLYENMKDRDVNIHEDAREAGDDTGDEDTRSDM